MQQAGKALFAFSTIVKMQICGTAIEKVKTIC